MKKYTIQPIDRARPFEVNELFFSVTDRRGIINACNDVFVRISGYKAEELLGEPHNVIRHPEMPRVVFKYLWDYLLAGKRIAAYVKNMANDGSYYWVVALAMPTQEGLVSIRFKPTSSFFPTIESLYEKLLKIEQRYSSDWREGMAESEKVLVSTIQSLGYASYDEFMHWMLHNELQSRDLVIKQQNLSLIPKISDATADSRAGKIFTVASSLYAKLDNMFLRLGDYSKLDKVLSEKAFSILKYTEGFRFISLNTSVRSSRLGAIGAPLAVISDYMRDASASITTVIDELSSLARFISGEIQSSLFAIACSKLQIEMLLFYSASNSSQEDSQDASTNTLRETLEGSVLEIHNLLEQIGEKLANLDSASLQLDKAMTSLQFIQISGLVEAVGLQQSGGFHLIFSEVRERIDEAKIALEALGATIRHLSQLQSDRKEIDLGFREYETQMASI